jgi:dTDP-4-amino-4,6-dideoxygalactose transaminase
LLDGVVVTPPCLPDVVHARHLYPIWTDGRDALLAELSAAGIPAAVHYPRGAHDQPCFAGSRTRDLPVTAALSDCLLSLPIHPELDDESVEAIAAAVLRARAFAPSVGAAAQRLTRVGR